MAAQANYEQSPGAWVSDMESQTKAVEAFKHVTQIMGIVVQMGRKFPPEAEKGGCDPKHLVERINAEGSNPKLYSLLTAEITRVNLGMPRWELY